MPHRAMYHPTCVQDKTFAERAADTAKYVKERVMGTGGAAVDINPDASKAEKARECVQQCFSEHITKE